MKNPIHHPSLDRLFRGALCTRALRLIPTALGLACALVASNAKAANSQYFTNPVTAGVVYSWDGANWNADGSTANTGPYTFNWTSNDFARFPGSSISYTVTVNQVESMAGLFGAAGSLFINDAGNGTGAISIVGTNSPTDGLPVEGFFTGGGQVTINCPIVGTGALGENSGGGHLQLFGTNSYSGGTLFVSSATFVDFNNSASFGVGPIAFANTTFSLFEDVGSTPITITNAIEILVGTTGIDFLPSAGASMTLSGPFSMGTFATNIRLASPNSTTTLTLSGPMSGSGVLNYSANSPAAPIIVSGANTYTGQTTIGGTGSANPIVSVTSINSVTTPAQHATSSLGKPSSAANGTIAIGATTVGGTLIYTGAGETSDRVISLAGTTGPATIEMDGTGPLTFTSAFTAPGAGSKTLTLQGSSTTANTIGGAIVDNSSANKTTLVKAQAGKWVLSGVNTYTGNTTISNGTLEISGSLASPNVTVNGGILQLDSATALSSPTTVTLTLASGLPSGSVNLNFSGQQTVHSLVTNGVAAGVGTYGSTTSSATTKLAVFTGNGIINVGGTPVVTTQPVSQSVWQGSSVTLSVVASSPAGTPTYQWAFNGASIGGANASSYTINPAQPANSGIYTCGVTNSAGGTVSAPAYLTVRTTNAYTSIVLSDSPIAYWRLDEKSGSTAYDAVGTNNATYVNCRQGVTPGYSVIDTNDTCVGMTNGNTTTNISYVQSSTLFPFFTNSANPQFTLEAWANSTNFGTGVQRLFSCMDFSANFGYGFGIAAANTLEFSIFGVYDMTNTITPLQPNVWYQLVAACDGSSIHFYVNGQPVGVQSFSSYGGLNAGNGAETAPMTLGADNWPPLSSTLHQEQLEGTLDECSIYGTFLGDSEVLAHYNAALPSAPQAQPVVADFPTNYVTETTTFIENAVGLNLSYQWYAVTNGVTNQLSGQNNNTLVLSGLTPDDAGKYYCNVSNTGGSTNAPAATLTVLPIPTSASQLNLTNGLVLHLPLASDYKDISGYSNNAVAVGAPQLVPSGTFASVVGNGSFNFSSGNNSSNYATLGKPASLQFSTNYDFTIAFWINQNFGDVSTNVPFFDNVVGGYGAADGYCIAPGESGGGAPNYAWAWSGGDGTHTIADQGAPSSISDGNWHHLAFVFSRGGNEMTYLDGQLASIRTIAAITNFDTTNVINIGQDAGGGIGYGNSGTTSAYMDDLGVWRRALTQLEVEGTYLGGISNSVSFAPPVVLAPNDTPVTITGISGNTLSYTGGSGSQFILLSASAVTPPGGSYTSWTRVATNSATPGFFSISTNSAAAFYVIQSK